eukprot:TRINITY_DN3648_c0_g1_i2.p1 TRINITY_DN3648_c0_g1~~TRINITY_DN3648_c0_g1_i2.p1  ORF type:complete len:137 (-),score=14.83 TRINITY_DN3648_c0_g1_i2:67-477(-)
MIGKELLEILILVPVSGTYDKNNRTHLINADGTFEFMIPLALLFETVRTLPAHYMNVYPVIQIKRAITTASGISATYITPSKLENGKEVGKIVTPLLTPEIKFSKIELVYNEIVFNDGIDTKAVELQYELIMKVPD